MTTNQNNKIYKIQDTAIKKYHPRCRRPGDWPGYRYARSNINTHTCGTVHRRCLTGIPTCEKEYKPTRGTIQRKSTNIQSKGTLRNRDCHRIQIEFKTDAAGFFWNTKKRYLPLLPTSFISVFVLAEICSSATPSCLPSSQGSSVAIEDSHAIWVFKISNNGGQTFYIAHPFLFYLGWWMQG